MASIISLLMRKTLRIGWCATVVAVVVLGSGCKKQQVAVPAAVAAGGGVKLAAEGPVPVARATSLGFAVHLPASTEAYFSTLNLPAHFAAAKESNYFKDLTAFLDDRVPAPATGTAPKAEAKPKAFEKLLGNDFFLSLGKGAAKSIGGLQQLSALYSEFTYHSLMKGTTPGAKPGSGGKDQMLAAILKDPEMVQRMAEALGTLELPPIMVGVRSDKPDEVLKELIPEEMLANVRKKARVSQVTTQLSGKFTMLEGTGKDLLTDELKKQWLALLPPESAAVLPALESAYATFQAKKYTLAYGTAGDYVIVTLGSARPDLQFITNPAVSLAARPEFSVMSPFQGKNLAAVVFTESGVLQAMQNPEPIQPMVRGLLAGLKDSPVFSGLAKTLEPKVAALGPIEHQLYAKPLTTLVGLAWWDKGLHVELDGGLSPKGLEGTKQLKFASLVGDPNVVMAMDYHGDPQAGAVLRDYVEGWADALHVAGLELAKANLFGEQGPKMATWIDLEIIPQLTDFYKASKSMFTTALGNEHAWVVDLGGHLPALPGLPAPDPKAEQKMVRLAGVDEVLDRKLIGDSWTQMETSLNGVAKAFPMLAGQKMPEVESTTKGGVTCYAYPSPFNSDDLTVCSSVGDKLFMIGTSRTLQEEIATRMLRADPSRDTPTMLWRLNWPRVREALKTFSPAAPAAPAADSMQAASKWMAPLGDMRGRLWIEAGHVRNSVFWEVKDTTKFD